MQKSMKSPLCIRCHCEKTYFLTTEAIPSPRALEIAALPLVARNDNIYHSLNGFYFLQNALKQIKNP